MKIYRRKSTFQLAVFLLLAFLVLLFFGPEFSHAQSPEATATPDPISNLGPGDSPSRPAVAATAIPLEQSPVGLTEVTFEQLNQTTVDLFSPIDQFIFFLTVPYRWVIQADNSYLELHYDSTGSIDDPISRPDQETNPALVAVYFDNILADTFIPQRGTNHRHRIPIPPEAVKDPARHRYQLRLVYLGGDCHNPYARSTMSIRNDSYIHFEYEQTPLEINLADFPYPVIHNLFRPESVLIIVPDQYSEADLAAAAAVSAAVGSRTYNNADVDILTASAATPARLVDSSAIIVGKPTENSFTARLYEENLLPTRLNGRDNRITGPADQPISADDGILQEIPSEYSDDHVYLIVTGPTDLAVSRAAQALSVLEPRYGLEGNLVVIADFRETFSDLPHAPGDLSLADLGFEDAVLYGINNQVAAAGFYIPANWRMVDQPTLTLAYINSSGLQSSTSGLVVKLNGNVVGSAPVDDSILGERQAVIQLPVADLNFGGKNRLSFETNLGLDLTECVLPDPEVAWIRLISEASYLELPYAEISDVADAIPTLRDSLAPLAAREDLGDVWLSLPADPTPAELTGMARAASWLGSLSGGAGFVPRVSVGAIDNPEQLQPYHLIAFGRPTRNPVIAALNEYLPQPFEPNQDSLQQKVGDVVYRLPDQFSLGLLQALLNPWNSEKVILVATGTTPESVEWAIDALTDRQTYYELAGDLTFVRDDRLETFESAQFIRGSMLTAVEAITAAKVAEAGAEPAAETEPTEAEDSGPLTVEVAPTRMVPTPVADGPLPEAYRPPDSSPPPLVNRLIFGLIGTGLVIALFGGVVGWRKTRNSDFEK